MENKKIQDFTLDQFTYRYNSTLEGLEIVTCDKVEETELWIPDHVDYEGETYPIVALASCSLWKCVNVEKLHVPSSIVEWDADVLDGCTKLNRLFYSGPRSFLSTCRRLAQDVTIVGPKGEKVVKGEKEKASKIGLKIDRFFRKDFSGCVGCLLSPFGCLAYILFGFFLGFPLLAFDIWAIAKVMDKEYGETFLWLVDCMKSSLWIGLKVLGVVMIGFVLFGIFRLIKTIIEDYKEHK